ncbi:MAG: DegQ family serine endoprotease [Dokdonella sp.]|nr:MAG: DegQ family serine endoprotease [Dokdonella sp.]
MQASYFRRSAVALMLFAALGAGYVSFAGQAITPAGASAAEATAAPAATTRSTIALPDFSAIVDRNGPAVVNISASGPSTAAATIDPEHPLDEFFRRFGTPSPPGDRPARGVGSGFIVSEDGLILTNAHDVDGATEVIVKLTDKREYPAKVVGIDPLTDVAVLRINASKLPVVRLGDPSRTRVGEWVVAIGSPFGFENSVTAGIVSAKSRSLARDSYVPFIQTDVAVNPGNSGGPLLNLDGEVIGINSQIYSRSGGYQGVSFAIPINVALHIQEQLLQHGKVSHGRLGVTIQEVTQTLAESFGLKQPTGALISSIDKGSPAAAAGLEVGDIILRLNDTEISRSSELPPIVSQLAPGTQVKLQIWRQGAHQEVTLAVGERSNRRTAASEQSDASGKTRLGLALRPLTRGERHGSDTREGLLVESVSGPAARAGIQTGDIVVALNGQPVHDVNQLRALLDKAGKKVALLIDRDNKKLFVPVEIG